MKTLAPLRFLGAAALIATASMNAHGATDGKKFKFLIPVDSALDEKPMRSSVAASRASVATPSSMIPVAPVPTSVAPAPTVAKTAAVSTPEFRQRFVQGIDHALAGDTRAALTIFNLLKTQTLPADERDRLMLAIARTQYQAGDDVSALEAYKQIRINSPSYLESLEERSWANMRLGRPQEALASLRTVMTPLFKERVSSEPYFLTSLAQLRVCDYQSVMKTLDLFKTRFRTRVASWESSIDPKDKARLRETSDTIQKLNLVEAEAIQRLYMDDAGKKMGGSVPKIAKESNQLTFPMDSDVDQKEVWLDEVDDYRVTVKGCPAPSALQSVAKKEGSL